MPHSCCFHEKIGEIGGLKVVEWQVAVDVTMSFREIRVQNVLVPPFGNDLFSVKSFFPGGTPSNSSHPLIGQNQCRFVGLWIVHDRSPHMEPHGNNRRLSGNVQIQIQSLASPFETLKGNIFPLLEQFRAAKHLGASHNLLNLDRGVRERQSSNRFFKWKLLMPPENRGCRHGDGSARWAGGAAYLPSLITDPPAKGEQKCRKKKPASSRWNFPLECRNSPLERGFPVENGCSDAKKKRTEPPGID